MPIPIGYQQANFIYSGPAVPTGAQWTLGLTTSTSFPTVAQTAAELDAVYGASGLENYLANDVNLTAILVKEGPDATGPSALEPSAQNSSGGVGAPPNTAYLVHKNTDFGGRAGRGRLYLPGVVEASTDDDGSIGATQISNIQTAMNNMLADLIADDLIPVLLHGDDSPLTTPSPITSFTMDSRIATQRRRLRR